MSRHSKWSKVKNQKGAADVKRGQIFSKIARLITVAAREGGGDPSFNFKLRLSIDRAKVANMPKDAIDRAVSRGAGTGEDTTTYETVLYEGFAPGGATVLIEALTDNRNRTLGEVRQVFAKRGGTFGSEGSVRWQFERRGALRFAASSFKLQAASREESELEFIEAGAEDLVWDAEGVTVYTNPANLQTIQESLGEKGYTVDDAGLEWVAKESRPIPDGDRESFERFLEALHGLDDVQEVYTNAAGI